MRTIRPINFGFALFCLFLSSSIASGQEDGQTQALKNNYNQVEPQWPRIQLQANSTLC
jgi:hypothetical protein